MKYVFVIYLMGVLYFCTSCEKHSSSFKFYKPTSDSIRYVGRVKSNDDSVAIYWSGTNILMRFKGTSLKAVLRDEYGRNYFNVIIDGDSLHYFKLDPGNGHTR